jgi:hypothetical protein
LWVGAFAGSAMNIDLEEPRKALMMAFQLLPVCMKNRS